MAPPPRRGQCTSMAAAAMLLTQLFFETQKKRRSRSAVTLPVSRALRRAVAGDVWLRFHRKQCGSMENSLLRRMSWFIYDSGWLFGACIQQFFSMMFHFTPKNHTPALILYFSGRFCKKFHVSSDETEILNRGCSHSLPWSKAVRNKAVVTWVWVKFGVFTYLRPFLAYLDLDFTWAICVGHRPRHSENPTFGSDLGVI